MMAEWRVDAAEREQRLRLEHLNFRTSQAALQKVWDSTVGTSLSMPDNPEYALQQLLAVLQQRDEANKTLRDRVNTLYSEAEVRRCVAL